MRGSTPWLILALLLMAPMAAMAEDVEAVTKPSADIELSFVRPGKVAEVPVKEGDAISAGQVLARLDDTVEQLQLLQLKAKAENQTKIDAAKAELAQKQEDLKKFEIAKRKGAATDMEVEHARLSAQIAKLSLEMARFEHQQDRTRYDEAKAEAERLRLISPISGLVEEVTIEPGESPQPLKTAVRVVTTDPLWIDAIAPLALAQDLKADQTVTVIFPGQGGEGQGERGQGKIIFVSAVSRAASDTLRLRVEVANPRRRPAGERVILSFPDAPGGN
jgi:RND family efflux transporter MFP subunit